MRGYHFEHRCGGHRSQAFARGPFGGGGGFRGREFGGFGGPGGHHRGRRRRMFDQTELQLLLLALVAEQPRHGYELIKEIEARSGGEYAPSPGVVYPAITFMEEQGLIALSTDESARKSYEATAAGLETLEGQGELIADLNQRLEGLAKARERAEPSPIRRAMQNLRHALGDRMNREDTTREIALQVAAIIDEAAQKIERIDR